MPKITEHIRRSVTPYLVVSDPHRTLDFVETVLGGERVREPEVDARGRIMHAEVRIGDSLVMIGRADEREVETRTTLYVEVDDVDAAHVNALGWGATSVRAPRDEPYGDRTAGADDGVGTTWWFATPITARAVA